MEDQLVIFISGVNKSIGSALARVYLSRPKYVVVGSVRNDNAPGVAELKACSKGSGSKLLLVNIESSSLKDPTRAIKELEYAGINHIDILIANAAVSPPLGPLETANAEEMASVFRINTLGPLALFQACHPLLAESTNAKFVTISSGVGSIGNMEAFGSHLAPAYGVSKTALQWMTVAAHCGNKWLTAFAIDPGLLQTDMGSIAVAHLGLGKAPHTAEEGAERIINLIDNSSRENSSGRFLEA
ncbi:putative aflatoxin biosynthesis ketoreductase nor-1 protein [Seiridium cardinale]|uniref:Aflatoxin biosynthesis ketoreductase nor-1 protein n=1 Tax=Seiridium cardinale TaxID=138064 RepID=A0ABR2Y3Z8_9PEZI